MIEIKTLDLPVEYHHTFEIYDSSKIQQFMDCPRKFFFAYVLGWNKNEPNIHLVFGSAWHDAMEHILNHGYDVDSVADAYMKFMDTFREDYPVGMDVMESKSPENAMKALSEYAIKWKRADDFDVLFTEVAGTVPVDKETVIYWKTDSIIRDRKGKYWSLEHKTTGKKTSAWLNKWPSKIQAGTYTHVLRVMFPEKEVKGIKINGAILRKSSNEFIRIPVGLSNKQMQQWMWEVRHWLAQIEWNFKELEKCKVEDDVMTAFPRNSESCGKFGCPHPELCNLMSNPLQRQDRVPLGYKKEFWNPADRGEGIKTNVDLAGGEKIEDKTSA